MPRNCALCNEARAILKRPKTGQQICKECFFYVFETEVHNTITEAHLFSPGDRVAIGASGGKGAQITNHKDLWPDDGTDLHEVWNNPASEHDLKPERFSTIGLSSPSCAAVSTILIHHCARWHIGMNFAAYRMHI